MLLSKNHFSTRACGARDYMYVPTIVRAPGTIKVKNVLVLHPEVSNPFELSKDGWMAKICKGGRNLAICGQNGLPVPLLYSLSWTANKHSTSMYYLFPAHSKQNCSNSMWKLARDLKVGPLDCARSALHTELTSFFALYRWKFSNTQQHLVVNVSESASTSTCPLDPL